MKYTISKYIKPLILILFWLSLIILIALTIYVFYQPKTEFFGVLFVNPIYSFIQSIPGWLYFVLYFILFSIISVIVFLSLSLYFNIQRGRKVKLKTRYFNLFIEILSSHFILDTYKQEDSRKRVLIKIKPFLKKKIQLIAFFESHLRLQETIAVNLSHDFKLLINDLSLNNKIEQFIYSNNFDENILMMKVLSYLRIHTYSDQIVSYAKSKNFALRTEAYAALIRLMDKDEILVDFIGEKHNLSFLDINIIVNAVLKNRKMNIDYRALLSSKNPKKIMVGLILAKFRYKRSKNNTILILNHIGNSNTMINKLAWDALLSIVHEDDCLEIIINRFEQEPDEVKFLILKNSQNLKNTYFYRFLAEVINHQSLLVKIEAMKIIFDNDFDLLSTFENSQYPEIKMAYNETACIYINN